MNEIELTEDYDWKVSYEDLEWKKARMPFFKQTEIVKAPSRKEAIEVVQGKFGLPLYGNFRASKVRSR